MYEEPSAIEQLLARIQAMRSCLDDVAALLRAEAARGDPAQISAHTIAVAAQALEAASEDLGSACAALPDDAARQNTSKASRAEPRGRPGESAQPA